MCALVDIFQAKVDKLLGDTKGVEKYISDIPVLIKEGFYKHIYQLIVIFDRLHNTGLKFDALKCSYGLKDITYLGYVITWYGIKHDLKKVQGIMDLDRPTTTTEARALIVMVQYYSDMWPRLSQIL